MAWTFMAVALLLLLFGAAQPAHSQSDQPAALTPTPTATPIMAPSQPFLQAPSLEGIVTASTNKPLGMPTFTWAVAVNALISHIQVSNTPGFTTLLIDTDTEATSYTPTGVWPDGIYYWRVKAAAGPANKRVWGEYSALWTFVKDWSDNGAIRPLLLQPPPDAVRSSFSVEDFAWVPIPGAAGYLIEIAADSQFATIVYKAETLKARHTPSVRLGSGGYFWRVTPFAYAASSVANRVYADPSESGRFTIDWTTAPVQLTPENYVATPFVPRFQWQAVEGAKSYQIQVSTDSGFNPTSTTLYNTANTDFTPNTNLSNDKEYYWRVKAIDQNENETSWSTIRAFRTQWNFAPKLLTPRNNQIQLSYPFFSWVPVPGAEQYQIQIDDNNQFIGGLIEDVKIYNVSTYTQPDWTDVPLGKDGYWRVRAIDASGNYTPWSETWAFRSADTVAPNLIYPQHTFTPDVQNLPVHRSATIAWPVFIWDTAHSWMTIYNPLTTTLTVGPDYYWLMVDDDPSFGSPNFSIQTRTLGAAPVFDAAQPGHAFSGLVDGALYYWRVQAIRNSRQMGVDTRWEMRYSRAVSELSISTQSVAIFPRDGYQTVASPPMLGWLPVALNGSDAYNYHVQISRTPDFSAIVDEAYPQFVNYAPWQGRLDDMPPGSYWWRVRAESSPNVELTPWSETRRFDLSLDLLTGNQYDFKPAPYRVPITMPNSLLTTNIQYEPSLTLVASNPAPTADEYALDRLHLLIDRSLMITDANIMRNLNWVLAFTLPPVPTTPVRYVVSVDNNHLVAAKPCGELSAHETDAGAPSLPPAVQAIATLPLYAPEYVLVVDWNGTNVGPGAVSYYSWNGVGNCTWEPAQDLATKGGAYWYDAATNAIQLVVPYSAFAAADDAFSGSLALALVSTNAAGGDGIRNSVPPQGVLPGTPANTIDNPIYVSDMLQPLYPFDMPVSNPLVHYDMPPLRWRMPVFDSVDGYQVQVARDERFSQVIETWESFETKTALLFALIPATFQSGIANADNESYYWRVRIRHERTVNEESKYDYGPWSPPQRFKLDSRRVGNPRLSTGSDVFMTPTFEWDRVEGAASYRLQVDDDLLFGSPLIDVGVDGTSYTPQETGATVALSSHVQYYWRVAMRRSDTVLGAWTPTMLLDKNSVAPVPLWPLSSQPLTVTQEQPTFAWAAVLTPSQAPRLAVPLYHLQVDNNEDFKSLEIDVATTATSYTPIKGKSLADGQWYWRVASYEATGKPGPFSAAQVFFKQYPQLVPVEPMHGGNSDRTPRFTWLPMPGAASYLLEVAVDSGFQNPTKYTTANTTFTPVEQRKAGVYYWRVRMIDQDGKEGPILPFQFNLGRTCYLPMITK